MIDREAVGEFFVTVGQTIEYGISQTFSAFIIADEGEKVVAAEILKEQAIYYGCRIVDNQLTIITPAMTFDEAYLWATAAERVSEFGKSTKWGIYTEKQSDAQTLALTLGSFAEPVFDYAAPGSRIYNHYHVNGRTFRNYFKHFHIWFGSPA